MLRNRGDGVEFRELESLLFRAGPAPLSSERREALREVIFTNLGIQDELRRGIAAALASPRWIAVPVGAGIAAAVIAASKPAFEAVRRQDPAPGGIVSGIVTVRGIVAPRLREGETATASTYASILFQDGSARVDLEPGGSIRLIEDGRVLALEWRAGSLSLASAGRDVRVHGIGWNAHFAAGGTALLRHSTGGSAVLVIVEGAVTVAAGGDTCSAGAGMTILVSPGGPCVVIPSGPGGQGAGRFVIPPVREANEPDSEPPVGASAASADPLNPSAGAEATAEQPSPPQTTRSAPPPTETSVTGGPEETPAPPPTAGGTSEPPPGAIEPPDKSRSAPSQANPPGNSGSAPGQASPPGNGRGVTAKVTISDLNAPGEHDDKPPHDTDGHGKTKV